MGCMTIKEYSARLHGLVIFRALLAEPAVADFTALVDALAAVPQELNAVCEAAAAFEAELFESGVSWGAHLAGAVLEAETACVRRAAAGPFQSRRKTAFRQDKACKRSLASACTADDFHRHCLLR